ncbi:amidase signature enzyme [Rhodofomes roseus]|uniref:Amidase signature enzyme n=1 Tax=Rhodofomes roseus TaxID=34475 RepID=A0ABQ8KQC9_9APHY|nr:amidase signature enzyme [Rhodofomes roseus]KAH9840829.1 amidase signature enzyme [Rhodofomes roseus]
MGSLPDLYEAGIEEVQVGLKKKRFTSVDLVKAYLARIEEVNLKGPGLRAVLETNPNALKQAAELDKEREVSGPRGPLHGIPILLKDNIATLHSEGMNTTAGSYALLDSVVDGESFVAARLRAAGAILLGKCTLSEWANWRGTVPSGFCGRGGQGTNPYVPLGNPSGSSSGSGIAGAIGLATGTLGSETDGSIISPSSHCNLVGLKPTVGLTSRAGVVPISEHQDSIGPMCRSVADCAAILSVIAGRDPHDNYSLNQPETVPDYTQALKKDGLRSVRLGVPRKVFEGVDANVMIAFNRALEDMKALGATIVDPADFVDEWDHDEVWKREEIVLCGDFKVNIHSYLSKLVEVPTGVRTVADLIKFNEENREKELVEPFWTDQATFIKSRDTHQDPTFWDALAYDYRMGRQDGVDGLLKKYEVDAILMPTAKASRPAAVAGYPVLTVPLGFQPPDVALAEANPTRMNGPSMPFGISFLGTAYSEFQLIQYAYAYEQATKHRLEKKAYPEAIPKTQLADVISK